jgi:hypothetical protein
MKPLKRLLNMNMQVCSIKFNLSLVQEQPAFILSLQTSMNVLTHLLPVTMLRVTYLYEVVSSVCLVGYIAC